MASHQDGAFRNKLVDEHAGGRDCQHADQAADGHDEADLGGRPVLLLQEDTQKWAEAVAHIRHKKIECAQRQQGAVHSFF